MHILKISTLVISLLNTKFMPCFFLCKHKKLTQFRRTERGSWNFKAGLFSHFYSHDIIGLAIADNHQMTIYESF